MQTAEELELQAGRKSDAAAAATERLPMAALLPLTMTAFVTVLTESLPAGLLPQMASGLEVSEALVGQLVTLYAIGSLIAAIPLTMLTQGWRRRPLLLAAIVGFAVANTVTAVSASYALTMLARLVAGVSAGLLWALMAGYAARMVPAYQQGRAIAVAMAGTPLALSLGVPAGTFLGTVAGWRTCFGIMSVLAVALIPWVRLKVPDFAGLAGRKRLSLGRVFVKPGVRSILFVVLTFVLAHNILYTYIAPFLVTANMGERTDLVLLMFGITSLIGIAGVGVLVDRRLRILTLGTTLLFAAAAAALWVVKEPLAIYLAIGCWGLAYGGAPTLFQTALAKTAGNAADIAQSMLVTTWNSAIAGGGLIGGVLLDQLGVGVFPPVLLALLAATWGVAWAARRHGFVVAG